RELGIERGEALAAERDTLRWRISVRPDGARLFSGALPTLIEWGDAHPADALPASGVTLADLCVAGLPETLWPSIGAGVHCASEGPPLVATLSTPRGRVVLSSLSI
ncbi:MAG TPA: VOC family protein, partial [Albitalea sp.]|nr:VOC family protein [Albitalea sp.]